MLPSINTGLSSIIAQQKALQVTSHNIANANTPGYSRQRVNLTSQVYGQQPGGVSVDSISRLRNRFFDAQYRSMASNSSSWDAQANTLQQVEAIFNEPSNQGVSQAMSDFFNSWQDLSNQPTSSAARQAVLAQGRTLAGSIRDRAGQLIDTQNNIDDSLKSKVDQVNQYASQIANINKEIRSLPDNSVQKNDLQDKQDLAADKLSKLVNLRASRSSDGQMTIRLTGHTLVENASVSTLSYDKTTQALKWNDGLTAQVSGGEIAGLMTMRTQTIPSTLDKLNTLAQDLADTVNTQHKNGYDLNNNAGQDFFTISDPSQPAYNIKVNPALTPDKVAASSATNQPGDGSNASALNAISQGTAFNGTSPSDYFQQMVGNLGIQSQHAQQMSANQKAILQTINNQRDSVKGVSVNEEMVNLTEYQRAFQAAAKVITVSDSMLNTVINRMGLTG